MTRNRRKKVDTSMWQVNKNKKNRSSGYKAELS